METISGLNREKWEEEKVTRQKKTLKPATIRSPHFYFGRGQKKKGGRELRKTSRQAFGRTIAFLACFDL